MRPPLITIVTPTFRRPLWLGELLDAVVPQLHEAGEDEMVIVDNCPDSSARAVVESRIPAANGHLRYLHEPKPGVVHARNTGVAAARGTHVLFLDDDEVPLPGWLAAFRTMAAERADIAIGRIVPRYESTPQAHLEGMLRRLYARDSDAPPGADVTTTIRLGTGNALFATPLLNGDATFDRRFNRTGGEDVRLIQRLLDGGARVRWVPDGAVEEIVPADRMLPNYLGRRRFTQGQIRCLLIAADSGLHRLPKLVLWMGVGLIQTVLNGGQYLAAKARGRPTDLAAIRMYGGLGKILWYRRAAALDYGGGH